MTEITEMPFACESLQESLNKRRIKAGSPALDCMAMTGEIIKNTSGECKKNAVYKKLPVHMKIPGPVMSKMFMEIMDYLLDSKRISVDRSGHICWTYSPKIVKFYEKSNKLKFNCDNNSGVVYFGDEKMAALYSGAASSSGLDDQNALKALNNAVSALENNIFAGDLIPKRIIPKKYNAGCDLCNLWSYNLGNSWKLIYSVLSDDDKRIIVLADWINRKDFERLFLGF